MAKELEDHERAHPGPDSGKVPRHGQDALGKLTKGQPRGFVDRKGRPLESDTPGWPGNTKSWSE